MSTSDALWAILVYLVTGLAYFAGLAFVLGMVWKLYGYLRTPMPWPAALTPAPVSEGGALARLLGNVTLFPALFRSDKFLWLGAHAFHGSLFFILLRHVRYVTYPVPQIAVSIAGIPMSTVGLWAGYLFGVATFYLFARRLALPRTLYLSGLPDYLALVLLGAVAASGLLVRYWAHVYLVDVKAFVLGLLTLHPVAPPAHPLFLVHFLLVLALLLYFPFGKLLHAGGVFFSPTIGTAWKVQQPRA